VWDQFFIIAFNDYQCCGPLHFRFRSQHLSLLRMPSPPSIKFSRC
jgi:hypothetical protein